MDGREAAVHTFDMLSPGLLFAEFQHSRFEVLILLAFTDTPESAQAVQQDKNEGEGKQQH